MPAVAPCSSGGTAGTISLLSISLVDPRSDKKNSSFSVNRIADNIEQSLQQMIHAICNVFAVACLACLSLFNAAWLISHDRGFHVVLAHDCVHESVL